MAMNFVQVGGAAGVGLLSGVLESQPAVNIGGQNVPASALAEGVALIGGVIAQFAWPYSMPALVDGIVDGGVALLAKRIVRMAAVPTGTLLGAFPLATRIGALNSGGARGLNASGVSSNKYQFV